jgi:hypothetical protein
MCVGSLSWCWYGRSCHAATMYLEFWKRKNAYLAWWWDVMDYEELVRVAHIHIHGCTSTHIHIHRCTPTYIHIHRCTSTHIHMHRCTPTHVHMHRCTPTHIHIHPPTSTYTHVHNLSVSLCSSVCLSVCLYVCVCVRVCMSVCLSVCMCMSNSTVVPFVGQSHAPADYGRGAGRARVCVSDIGNGAA